MKTQNLNPISNDVFDTRDLIEYLETISTDLVDIWNDFADEDHQSSDIDDIFGTKGYEYANDVKDVFANYEEVNEDEIDNYKKIYAFCDDLKSESNEFEYGEPVIHSDYFTEYTKELLVDCGYIPKDMPSWIEIDYDATAENVKADYAEVSYDGETYYIRNV